MSKPAESIEEYGSIVISSQAVIIFLICQYEVEKSVSFQEKVRLIHFHLVNCCG